MVYYKPMKAIFGLTVSLNAFMIAALDVTVRCEKDISCPTGFAYTYQSGGIKKSLCTEQCQQFQMTVDLFECDPNSCPTGYCIGKQYSASACLYENTECPTTAQFTVTCGDCQTLTCSTEKCVLSQGLQICSPYNQCPLSYGRVSMENCPDNLDINGVKCKCCVKGYGGQGIQEGQQQGVCSNTLPYDSTEFRSMSEPPISSYILIVMLLIILHGM